VLGTHGLKSVCECLHDGVSEELWGKVRPFSRRPPYTRPPYVYEGLSYIGDLGVIARVTCGISAK